MTPAEIQAAIKASALKKKQNYKEPVVKQHKMTADEYKGLQRAKEAKAMRRRKPIFELDDLDILPAGGEGAVPTGSSNAVAGADILREINQARADLQRQKEDLMKVVCSQPGSKTTTPSNAAASNAELAALRQEVEQLRTANQELRTQVRKESTTLRQEMQKLREEMRQWRQEMASSPASRPASPTGSAVIKNSIPADSSPRGVADPLPRSSPVSISCGTIRSSNENHAGLPQAPSLATPTTTSSRVLKPYETGFEPSRTPERRRTFKPYEVGYEQRMPSPATGSSSSANHGSISSYKPYDVSRRTQSQPSIKTRSSSPAAAKKTTGIKVTNLSGSSSPSSSPSSTVGIPGLGPHSIDTIVKYQGKDNALKGFISNQAAANSMYTRNDLTIKKLNDGTRIVLFKNRLYIPNKLRAQTLEYYSSQFGVREGKRKVMEECIWPEVTRDTRMFKP